MKIVIDGNIGSGKSTQAKFLIEKGYNVLPEQIQDWPLKEYYKNPSRFAMALQLAVLKSLTKSADIYERSPESSKEIFWKMLMDDGVVTQIEDDIYSWYYNLIGWSPEICIYIDTPVDVCFERILSREQVGDSKISKEQLHKIYTYYTKYFSCKKHVIIDGSQTPEEIHKQILFVLDKVNGWMHRTHEQGNKM